MMWLKWNTQRFILAFGFTLLPTSVWSAPSLTISPSPAEDGNDVQFTCSYVAKGQDPDVFILFNGNNRCWYAGGQFLSFDGRVVHNPQNDYHNEFIFTLKNVTVTDRGDWECQAGEEDKTTVTLDVYVPPRDMRVFMVSQPPYTESTKKTGSADSPTYTVNCTFSAYPADTSVLWPTAFVRNNSIITAKNTLKPISVLDGTVYNVTMSASFPLTKEDNGEKSLRCEVTWRRGTERERHYSAEVEKPLNVTFPATNGISMSAEYTILLENNITTSPTCTWGSANPPRLIKWIFKDPTVSAATIGDKSALPSTSHYEAGEFHGQTTVSRLTVTRELNQRAVSCCVTDGPYLHCKHNGVLDVRFPPTTATITTSGVPIVGETMILTCTTDSSHPHNNITWDLPSHGQTDGTRIMDELTVKPGDFGGTVSTSTVTFVVRQDFLGQFECSVMWNGEEVQSLRRTHIIGTATTTPLISSTVSEDDTNSQFPRSSSTPDNTGAIIGGSLGTLLVVSLIIIIIVVILWKRQVPFPGNKDKEKNRTQNHVNENDGAEHTTTSARQRGESQRTHGDGEYEDVTDNVQRTQGTSDYEEVNGTNQQRVTRVEYSDRTQGRPDQVILNTGEYIATGPNNEDRNDNSQSAYSSLGPHTSHESPAPPNVYDRLSPYENM